MSNRRPPRPRPPRHDDPNQTNFFDKLRFYVVNADYSKSAVVSALTISAALLGLIVSTWRGVISIVEAAAAIAALMVCAAGLFAVEAYRSKGLEPEKAYRWHVVIGALALLVPGIALGYVASKAHTQEQVHQAQEQRRLLAEKRERDQQKKEQDEAAARKAEEARKAERTKCEQDRKWVMAQAEKQRPDAHKALVACTEAYAREKKTTEDTVAQRCWTELRDLAAIDRRKQAAEAKKCDTPSSK